MPIMEAMSASVACEACTLTGNMGLQMALCGAVGGVVMVKLAANDLLDKLFRRRHGDEDEHEAECGADSDDSYEAAHEA
jgi:hypothetical protein